MKITLIKVNINMNNKMEDKLTINKYKSDCLAIVESHLTEEPIDEKEFLKNCGFITKMVYNDIITERSLIDLCGYALCPNRLSINSNNNKFKSFQKYHISLNQNRVYDITERKMFCSNLCFKSSHYLREQISEEPLWMRNESITQKTNHCIHLYDKKVGQIGDEVVFDEQLIISSNLANVEDDYDCQQNKVSLKNNISQCIHNKDKLGFPYIKEEYLEQLKDQMKGLTIKEKIDDSLKTFDINEETSESNCISTEHKNNKKTCD